MSSIFSGRRAVVWACVLVNVAILAGFFLSVSARAETAVSAPGDMIAQAREAYNNHDFKAAAAAYQKYLSQYPDGPDRDEAGFFYAQCLFLLHDLGGADKAFAAEERKNRKYADQVLFYRGEIAAMRREFSNALVFFDRLSSEHPDSMMAGKAKQRLSDLHYYMANDYMAQGAYSLALQNYLQTADASSDVKPLAEYKLGKCYKEMGNLDQAVAAWDDLSLSEAPKAKDAALLAQYRLARLLEDRGSFVEAELNYQALLAAAPDHMLTPLSEDGLARVWAKEGKAEEAAAYWKKQSSGSASIVLSKKYGDALDHFLHEEYKDAETDLAAVVAGAPDREMAWKARLLLARAYTGQGRRDKMAAAWQDVASDPDQANNAVRMEAGQALLDLAPATTAKLARQTLDSGDAAFAQEALGLLASALSRVNDAAAADAANQYLGKYPDGQYAGELFLLRGRKSLAAGDLKGAEADLQKAQAMHPDPEARIAAMRELARVYETEGRMDSAKKVLNQAQEAARSAPGLDEKLRREAAEVSYAQGDYASGVEVYAAICEDTAAASCPPQDRFRLFWGLYRSGKSNEAEAELTRVEAAGGDWAFRAGLWRGMMLLENDKPADALAAWQELKPANELDAGILAWQVAAAQAKSGAADEARQTLLSIDKNAPDAGLYTRGQVLALALEAGDFNSYIASLPDPAIIDKQTLSEDALLNAMREKAKAGAAPADLEAVNGLLQVEADKETVAEEGTLLVAKAGLYSATGRAEAMNMLDDIMTRDPGTPFAGEIKLYKGEDAFFKKDYPTAASWLKDVKPVDVPEDLRFRLVYLQGQNYKQMRNLEAMRPCFLTLVSDYKDQDKSPREWLDAGIGLTLTRDFSAAKTAIALSISQSNDQKLLAEANYWKGMVEEGSGDLDAALATFLGVANKYPDQVMWTTTALYEAAEVCMQKGDYDQALKSYGQVLDRAKGNKNMSDQVKAKMAQARKLKQLQNPLFNPSPAPDKGKTP
jgi:tetratricopeptide (TPR) repeat protein